ncbi:E3 ubiquitin-protein ligase COP1 [Aethina tumida]|uniref:E3 ubiquitin-protein ligase COP1 n=1 Tax=Aethina tumida TaxID=116153 RepID=UPI00096AE714|nr:E3 ubiquitin-protein ligase COP1 [Aethina tumida]XP_019874813.1 E3 ubiquitin-protein ligase COP1 [Aethina tumida]
MSCQICRAPFTKDSDVASTPCGHLFDYNCIVEILETTERCPKCDIICTSDTLLKVYISFHVFEDPEEQEEEIGQMKEQLDTKSNSLRDLRREYIDARMICNDQINEIKQMELQRELAVQGVNNMKEDILSLKYTVSRKKKSITFNVHEGVAARRLLFRHSRIRQLHRRVMRNLNGQINHVVNTYEDFKRNQNREKIYLETKLRAYKRKLEMFEAASRI